ncbi:MAG: hypothetical protein QOF44_1497 [Streptomyces sp.]|nr:hypothetical protein [Streptomyces sp.]
MTEGTASHISAWWHSQRPTGTAAYLVDPSGSAGATVLRELHSSMSGSVLVDASGLTAEQVHEAALHALGVDLAPGRRDEWRSHLYDMADDRLLIVTNTHRAGPTRRSSEPEHLISGTVEALATGRVAVLAHVIPRDLPDPADEDDEYDDDYDDEQDASRVLFQLPEHDRTGPTFSLPDSTALRALALAEPRVVPTQAWAELTTALSGEPASVAELDQLAAATAELLPGPDGVAFADEGLAEALRQDTDPAELRRVNRHMTDWLSRHAPEFGHPTGWSQSGPLGLYAASGLAMHAAQAGTFDELLRQGGPLANIPQTALLDAAYCAFEGNIPGNSAAADALYLWLYGVVPPEQPEWASWLHLMSTTRGDGDVASAVAESGVRLPWKAAWTRWRPPGGYHLRFLGPGPVDGLAAVRWQGRPAVAGLYSPTSRAAVWDAATGELLAGPWNGKEIPAGHRADLAWPAPPATGPAAPETFRDLWHAVPDARSAHFTLLHSPPLFLADHVILGGSGGLLAIEPSPGVPFEGFTSPNVPPLSDLYAAPGEIAPVGAPPPSPSDLAELYGADEIRDFDEDEIPEGLTDEATRRTLLSFGLPDMREGGMGIYPWGDDRLEDVLTEIPWPPDIERPEETGPFFQIGRWMGGALVIDGASGHVLRIPAEPGEDELAALPAAFSLENFLAMVALWITGLRTRAIIEEHNERSLLPQHVLIALLRIDKNGVLARAWAYALHNG